MNGYNGYTTPKPSPFMVPAWSSSRSLFPKNNVHLIVQKLESRRLEKAVEVLDNHLKDRDYLLASGFSAADVNVGYSIHLGDQFVSS